MKKWNTPEVTELNITETASGDTWFWFEGESQSTVCVNGKCQYTTNTFGPKNSETSGGTEPGEFDTIS